MKWFQHVAAAALALGAAHVCAQSTPAATPAPAPAAATAAPAADGRSADTWLRDGDVIFIQYAPKTIHFSPSPEHAKWTHLVNLEIRSQYDRVWGADETLFGIALFKNSFDQSSQYLYWGQKWDLHPNVYAKVTAGLLHGYRGKYRDKIPFNRAEVAPAIIPSIGLRMGKVSLEGILLGGSAFQFAIGYTFK